MSVRRIQQKRFQELPRLLSLKDTIAHLQVSRTKLWELEKQGMLIPTRVGAKIMYAETDIINYLNKVNENA